MEFPFDSDRKLMTTVHALADGGSTVCVKGAPQELLARCTAYRRRRRARAADRCDPAQR